MKQCHNKAGDCVNVVVGAEKRREGSWNCEFDLHVLLAQFTVEKYYQKVSLWGRGLCHCSCRSGQREERRGLGFMT